MKLHKAKTNKRNTKNIMNEQLSTLPNINLIMMKKVTSLTPLYSKTPGYKEDIKILNI